MPNKMNDNTKSINTNGSLMNSQTQANTGDEEVIENLELLMNMDSLEQADSWDILMNMADNLADDEEQEN